MADPKPTTIKLPAESTRVRLGVRRKAYRLLVHRSSDAVGGLFATSGATVKEAREEAERVAGESIKNSAAGMLLIVCKGGAHLIVRPYLDSWRYVTIHPPSTAISCVTTCEGRVQTIKAARAHAAEVFGGVAWEAAF